MARVAVRVEPPRVEGLEAGGNDHGADVQVEHFLFLLVIDGIGRAHLRADAALLSVSQLAAVFGVDGIGGRNRLGVVFIDRLAEAQPRLVVVHDGSWALLGAGPAGNTLVRPDVPRLLADFYREISFLPLDAFDLRIGEKVDVQVPADLDQLGGDNSHGAFVRREGLVQLGHPSADRRAFFEQMDEIS